MEVVNHLGIAASALPSMAPDGRPLLVLIAKASFELTAGRQAVRLADEQLAIHEVDVFEGEPGLSPPLYEADTAPYKPLCDVLMVGSAYSHGRPAPAVRIGLQVGSLQKSFEVWGARNWQRSIGGMGGWRLSDAETFEQLKLSYALAYGGADGSPEAPEQAASYAANPVGRGFYARSRSAKFVEGQPAAQTQVSQQAPDDPWKLQPSLSLGALGRNWQPRLQQAGTFDELWKEQRFPLLPTDFNPEHWQSAPPDQRLDALPPGLPVQLWNMSPEGHLAFELPTFHPQVFFTRSGRLSARPMRADTLLIEPDAHRFTLVWRTHWVLLRSEPPIERLELRHA